MGGAGRHGCKGSFLRFFIAVGKILQRSALIIKPVEKLPDGINTAHESVVRGLTGAGLFARLSPKQSNGHSLYVRCVHRWTTRANVPK